VKHFIRHYLEMVAAMLLGMAVLGLPAGLILEGMGSSFSEVNDDAPAVALLGMAVSMTAPMVAWMRFRGHGWRACSEMAAAMFLPTFVAIALIGTLAFDDLMALEQVAMLLAMLVAMLLRPSEYTHQHSGASMAALRP
jgi:hypothetical protein